MIELKIGEGVWHQKVEVEDAMISCPKCLGKEHLDGHCPIVLKGKGLAQNILAKELMALTESTTWEDLWISEEWGSHERLLNGQTCLQTEENFVWDGS